MCTLVIGSSIDAANRRSILIGQGYTDMVRMSTRAGHTMALAVTIAVMTVAAMAVGGSAPTRPAMAARAHSAWSTLTGTSDPGTTMARVAGTIGATSSAAAGLDGTGVGIALIDTGVVPAPGLPASQIVNGPDLSFESQSASLRYLDTYGHGTHLAGIIVGNDPTTGFKGIAPKAKLTSIKVGASNGAVDVAQVIAALDWVVTHRSDDPANPIKIVCLAYGTDATANLNSDPLLFAVENANAAGILVVVASGNAGTSLKRVNSPAMDPMSLTVGSSATQGTLSLADDRLSTFTSVDPTAPIDLVAPGESIVSLRNPGSYIDNNYPAARVGDTLFRGSGSSQASAVVAGAAALMLQKYPSTPPHRLRQWLRTSATPLTGPNAGLAYGSLNLAAALSTREPQNPLSTGSSTGLGSLEAARGTVHAMDVSTPLTGNAGLFGAFSTSQWVTQAKSRTAWRGGLYLGTRMAGDGWTGSSWATRTWAAATWAGSTWDGRSWVDANWAGRYWAGRYWASTNWSGRYWSASIWETRTWSTATWG
jgi:serine protease AprX